MAEHTSSFAVALGKKLARAKAAVAINSPLPSAAALVLVQIAILGLAASSTPSVAASALTSPHLNSQDSSHELFGPAIVHHNNHQQPGLQKMKGPDDESSSMDDEEPARRAIITQQQRLPSPAAAQNAFDLAVSALAEEREKVREFVSQQVHELIDGKQQQSPFGDRTADAPADTADRGLSEVDSHLTSTNLIDLPEGEPAMEPEVHKLIIKRLSRRLFSQVFAVNH